MIAMTLDRRAFAGYPPREELDEMRYEKPEFVEIDMNAEIGAYQAEFLDTNTSEDARDDEATNERS